MMVHNESRQPEKQRTFALTVKLVNEFIFYLLWNLSNWFIYFFFNIRFLSLYFCVWLFLFLHTRLRLYYMTFVFDIKALSEFVFISNISIPHFILGLERNLLCGWKHCSSSRNFWWGAKTITPVSECSILSLSI